MEMKSKHHKAIELMVYTPMKYIEIAKEVGVSNNTITAWTKDANFQEELQKEIRRKFSRMATKATRKLETLIDSEKDDIALRACTETLNKAGLKEVEKVESTNKNITVEVVDDND